MNRLEVAGIRNFLLFAAFSSGMVLGAALHCFLPPAFLALCSLGSACFWYWRRRFFFGDICLVALFCALGACWQNSLPVKPLDRFRGAPRHLHVQTLSLPRPQAKSNALEARLIALEGRPFGHTIKVIDYTRSMEYLKTYRLRATLSSHRYKDRIVHVVRVGAGTAIQEVPPGPWLRWQQQAAAYLLDSFQKYLSHDAYCFLSAAVLGRKELLYDWQYYFSRAGASHLLAISGSNIGLMAAVICAGLGFFHISLRKRISISLLFLYLYIVLIGAPASSVRAIIMFTAFFCSFLMRRRTHPLNSLALAGFIMLLFDHRLLFDIGFQLSFLAVFAIIAGFMVWEIPPSFHPVARYTAYLFLCSVFVSVFLVPLISVYFGTVQILGAAYNLVFIPLFTAIIMLALLLGIFSFIPLVAYSIGAVISLLVHIFLAFVWDCAMFRFSALSYTFSWKQAAFYYVILGSILAVMYWRKRVRPA